MDGSRFRVGPRPTDRVGHRLGRLAVAGLGLLALVLAGTAGAQTLTIEETERLVRVRYFEGLPAEQADRIGPEGAARLLEMLADPKEAANHDQILIALGVCAPPEALAAISDWAEQPRRGEVDRATFRAWQALPYALGHLSRRDRRAVARLEAQLAAEPPRWHHRHHRGDRLARLAQRAAANALAESGVPEARRALDRAVRSSRDADMESFLRDARARHAHRAQELAE